MQEFTLSNSQTAQPFVSNLGLNELTDISMVSDNEDPDDPLIGMGHIPSQSNEGPSVYDDYNVEWDSGPGQENSEEDMGPVPSDIPQAQSQRNGRVKS